MVKNDRENLHFLWVIMKQHERSLKFTDWKEVAEELGMTKDHAARMRFFRLRKELDAEMPHLGRRDGQGGPSSEKGKGKGKDGTTSKATKKTTTKGKGKRKVLDEDVTDDEEPLYDLKRRRHELPEDNFDPHQPVDPLPSDRVMRVRDPNAVYVKDEDSDVPGVKVEEQQYTYVKTEQQEIHGIKAEEREGSSIMIPAEEADVEALDKPIKPELEVEEASTTNVDTTTTEVSEPSTATTPVHDAGQADNVTHPVVVNDEPARNDRIELTEAVTPVVIYIKDEATE